jgi:hypothetical protein
LLNYKEEQQKKVQDRQMAVVMKNKKTLDRQHTAAQKAKQAEEARQQKTIAKQKKIEEAKELKAKKMEQRLQKKTEKEAGLLAPKNNGICEEDNHLTPQSPAKPMEFKIENVSPVPQNTANAPKKYKQALKAVELTGSSYQLTLCF